MLSDTAQHELLRSGQPHHRRPPATSSPRPGPPSGCLLPCPEYDRLSAQSGSRAWTTRDSPHPADLGHCPSGSPSIPLLSGWEPDIPSRSPSLSRGGKVERTGPGAAKMPRGFGHPRTDSSLQSYHRAPRRLPPPKQYLLIDSLKPEVSSVPLGFPGVALPHPSAGTASQDGGRGARRGGTRPPKSGSQLPKPHCSKQSPGPPQVGTGLNTREASAKGRQ